MTITEAKRSASPDDLGLNGLPEAFAIDWRLITALEISPIAASEAADGETSCALTSARNADMWSIYARLINGEAMLLHDADDETACVGMARQILRRTPIAMVAFIADDRMVGPGSIADLSDRLAEIIQGEIPGCDDPADFRDDDFDAHPLAALREALLLDDQSGAEGA